MGVDRSARMASPVVVELERRIAQSSLRAVARKAGVSEAFVCDVRYGRRGPGRLAAFLGFELVYQRQAPKPERLMSPVAGHDHAYEQRSFYVCRHCRRTEADIVNQCHHCDEAAPGERCFHCLRLQPSEPVLTRAEAGQHVRAALRLAREATNSLACVARARYQHDAVDRLHREIDAMAALFPEGGQG